MVSREAEVERSVWEGVYTSKRSVRYGGARLCCAFKMSIGVNQKPVKALKTPMMCHVGGNYRCSSVSQNHQLPFTHVGVHDC